MTWGERFEAFDLARKAQDGPAFLDALIKARFDPVPTFDEAGKIDACRQLAARLFESSTDQWMQDRFKECASATTSTDAASAVHDLLRGYSESERAKSVADAVPRRARLIARIAQSRQDNSAEAQVILQLPTPTHGQKEHKGAYDQNVAKLDALKSRVQQQSDEAIAGSELSHLTAIRHMPSLSRSLWFTPFTYEEWIVDGCDADWVTFPFRFLIHAPLRMYRGLLDKWKKTKDADAVTNELAAEIFTGAYGDRLVALFKETPFGADADAADVIAVLAELRDALLNRRLQSVTLLAVTQAEGIIWRYAALLNSSGYDVYETNNGKKIAGKFWWNPQTCKYEAPSSDDDKRDAKRPMNSARDLLSRTRIEQAFRPNVADQVIAEYADDRNSLAHGSLIADERLAVQAALLLGTVFQCIIGYEAEGRPACPY
ncbi:MAG: hypothetical protein IT432_14895 [Phycisphaerales bacterium]|nr:hypothetical protein [Phycisphaerales bacterium]